MISEVGSRCTGCKACGDACPKGAISFVNNEEGFWYPVVNEEECVHCGKCRDVCCALKQYEKEEDFTPLAYAAWNRNDEIRRASTSGGIYYCFAKYVLENGGYIIGSVYTDDFRGAYHTYSNDEKDLPRIMGSKYFQSDTEGIYKTTKKLLQEGKTVLFTGSPCQVVALKKYLGKVYQNLITLDFICKGVPSPMIQALKIDLYEKEANSKIVDFRDKCDKYAWVDFGEYIKFENGKEKFISRWQDDTFDCFVRRNLNARESCYECKIKNGTNASEITIGDFWGVKRVTERDLKMGVSALIVNNAEGQVFLDKLNKTIYTEQRPLEEIKNGNPAYGSALKRPEKRNAFFKTINESRLETAVKAFSSKTHKEKISSAKRVFSMKTRRWRPLWRIRKDINWCGFIKYNYFVRNIQREKDAFIIPLKGSVIQLGKKSKVILHGNLILNYNPSYKRGNQSTLFKVEDEGEFIANNRVEISYNNTIVVNRKAKLKMGYLYSNIGTNIICNSSISFGNHILIGRDVCVFDSDYHRIYNQEGNIINGNQDVVVGDNVWIGTRSMVLKGSHIENGAVIGANSMVMGNVDGNKVFINAREAKSIGENIYWQR